MKGQLSIMDTKNNLKPLTLAKEDYINSLVKLTNQSQLPLLIIEYILKDFLNEIHVLNQQQAEIDRQTYEKELNENKDGDK